MKAKQAKQRIAAKRQQQKHARIVAKERETKHLNWLTDREQRKLVSEGIINMVDANQSHKKPFDPGFPRLMIPGWPEPGAIDDELLNIATEIASGTPGPALKSLLGSMQNVQPQ